MEDNQDQSLPPPNPQESQGPNNVVELYELCKNVFELGRRIQKGRVGQPMDFPEYGLELDMEGDKTAEGAEGISIDLREIPLARDFLKIKGQSVDFLTMKKHVQVLPYDRFRSLGETPHYELRFQIHHPDKEDDDFFDYYFGANGETLKWVRELASEDRPGDWSEDISAVDPGDWELITTGGAVFKVRLEDIARQEGIV